MSLKENKEIEQKIFERYEAVSDSEEIVSAFVPESHFIWQEIRNILQGFEGGRVLDVGCGKGKFISHIKKLNSNLEILGLEPVPGLLTQAVRNHPDVKFVQASATNIPFPDEYFDVLICVSVLQQIPDTDRALSEMARVLKQDGRLIIFDKNILSLHPRYLIPTIIWNTFLGEKNKWLVFPRNFIFHEKYFIPWKLNKKIKMYCKDSKFKFIRYVPERKKYPLIKGLLISIRTVIACILHKTIPFLDFYVIWEAIK